MHTKTITGVAPASYGSAPGATVLDGRYRFSVSSRVIDKPVVEITLTDVRVGLDCALTDASNALRDGRHEDAAKYVADARLLSRALRRLEVHQARVAGAR